MIRGIPQLYQWLQSTGRSGSPAFAVRWRGRPEPPGRLRACPERSRMGQSPLPDSGAVSRQPALAEPGEISSDARDAFEAEWFDRFASNVCGGFLHRVGSVDQA